MDRHVRGSFFAEYVRMVRRRKNVDWSRVLSPRDLAYTQQLIDPNGWYPMETFERLGNAILSEIEGATLEAVRLWGRYSAQEIAAEHPDLVLRGDPVESMMRLKVLRSTLFDFPAFDIPFLVDGTAEITIDYRMGKTAEEAACWQTMGFCEGVLMLAGADAIHSRFVERSWEGSSRTRALLEWASGR